MPGKPLFSRPFPPSLFLCILVAPGTLRDPSGTLPGRSGTPPGRSWYRSGRSQVAPGRSRDAPGTLRDAPGMLRDPSGTLPGRSGCNLSENSIKNRILLPSSIESRFFRQPICKNLKTAERTPTESTFSFATLHQGPGAEPCRRQLRSAPGPKAPKAC